MGSSFGLLCCGRVQLEGVVRASAFDQWKSGAVFDVGGDGSGGGGVVITMARGRRRVLSGLFQLSRAFGFWTGL